TRCLLSVRDEFMLFRLPVRSDLVGCSRCKASVWSSLGTTSRLVSSLTRLFVATFWLSGLVSALSLPVSGSLWAFFCDSLAPLEEEEGPVDPASRGLFVTSMSY